MQQRVIDKVLQCTDEKKVIDLARNMMKIPSPTGGETALSEFVASYLEKLGMEVTLQNVQVRDRKSKQVVGRFRGNGEGPSLMFCGHLDTNVAQERTGAYTKDERTGYYYFKPELWTKEPFGAQIEDGWLYGLGAINMKASVAAMIIAASAAKESLQLKGDIVVACMAAEMAGNVGVQEMLKTGVKADMAVVPEATNLEIEPANVGTIIGKIRVEGTSSRERYSSMYSNAIERACRLIDAFGPTHKPITPGGWLTFEPEHLLPGYPRIAPVAMECPLYSTLCTLTYRLTTVPGQTDKMVRDDLDRLIGKFRAKDPDFNARLEPMERVTPPIKTSLTEPIVKTMAKWQKYVTEKEPVVESNVRLGTITDGGLLSAAGMKTIVYGPAMADPWPMADERVKTGDVMVAARVMALTVADLCG